jgi:glycosyltransferase involved in cell wall biosynthesis
MTRSDQPGDPQDKSDLLFLVFGDDWGRHVSTTQHIFRRIARDHSIIWLNAINHRTPKFSMYDLRRAAGKLSGMLKARKADAASGGQNSVWGTGAGGDIQPARLVPPRILPWHNIAPVRWMNTRVLLHDLRAALDSVAPGKRPILLTATPAIPDVVRELDARLKIYFCIDDYAEIQGVDADLILPLERETLTVVDAVVATAKSLVESKRAPSGKGFYLPQGVNYEHFSRERPLPADLAAIPRPRVGFAGDLALRCDIQLIRDAALSHPHWSFVFVGPVNVDTSPLDLPNVHIMGNRPYADLPAYVQGFDVGLIPYVLSAWTIAVDPLKLLEYLASGIPVVSLPLPEVYKYSPPVFVADGHDAFCAAVESALAEPESERAARRAIAREHTWERRADRLLQIVDELSAEEPRPELLETAKRVGAS